MNEYDLLLRGLVVVIVLIAIPIAFIHDKKLHEEQPSVRPYKWGYYIGYAGLIGSVLFIFLVVLFSAALALFLVLSIPQAIASYYIIRRKKWAWVLGTILTLNPILWIAHIFYGRNRWGEFG